MISLKSYQSIIYLKMKVFFIFLAIYLIKAKSILSENPTCAVYDFNDPLVLSKFQDCGVLPTMTGSKALVIQNYNDSSLTPFRLTSETFLTTNKSVNFEITQCLCTKDLFRGNFSSFSFKIAVNLQNKETNAYNNIQFFVSNILSFQIDPGTNGWKLYERDFSSPNYGTFDDAVIGIKVRIGNRSELGVEYIKFYNPRTTNEDCEPLTTSSIPPQTTTDEAITTVSPVAESTQTETTQAETTTQTQTTQTQTTQTQTTQTDFPDIEVPPNENPTCLRVDFNDSISLPNAFQECDGQYLPGLIVKSYRNTAVTPYRETSTNSNYLSNRWEGLSCLETSSIFAVDEKNFIESVIYLNGQWPGAWIEILVVDVYTGEQEVLKNLRISNEWRLLSEEVKRKFSNARIVIMTNMNSYSQLAMEYFNISNRKSNETFCLS